MGMTLTLDQSDQELLLEELEVFTRSLQSPEAQARYTALRQAVEVGRIEGDALAPLEQVLEIALQTGRVRRIHGPQAEQALLRLFHQTGRGTAIRETTQRANQALKTLRGHVVDKVTFTPYTPGVYRLTIDTDHCRLTLKIDGDGVWVENVAVGLY